MKRTRQQSNTIEQSGKRLAQLPPHIEPIGDVWFVILSHSIEAPWDDQEELAHKPLILSLGLVSKQWYYLMSQAIRCAFTKLRLHSLEVDKLCKMRYPIMLWELKQEMAIFCRQLAMTPVGILVVVEPAWLKTPLNEEETRLNESYHLGMISSFSNCRIQPQRLSGALLRCIKEVWPLLMGPWSFGGTWSAYMLNLFLECCDRDHRGYWDNDERDLVVDHFEMSWGSELAGKIKGIATHPLYPLAVYYQLKFPAKTTSVLYPFNGSFALRPWLGGGNMTCYNDFISANTFYGLFPTLKHWLEYLKVGDFLLKEQVDLFLDVIPFEDRQTLYMDEHWNLLFRNPLEFSDQRQCMIARNQIQDNLWLRTYWQNSKKLQMAYTHALLRGFKQGIRIPAPQPGITTSPLR